MKFEQVTIILNRECPRNCTQCGLADHSRAAMSIDKWIEALAILKAELGVRFFLFLGTEPLLFGSELAKLVRWLNENNPLYGFYSTSPEPLFTRHRQELVDAGLQSWSAGIDGLPGMYMDLQTDKKSRESIVGLQWMGERGVSTHAQITIHKKNYRQVPQIMQWCLENIKNVQVVANFIEWKKTPEMDFFSRRDQMADLCWTGSSREREEIRRMLAQLKDLSRVEGYRVQLVDHYLDHGHESYDKLNVHCEGYLGPAVDADGDLRLCGYSTGKMVKNWTVFDLPFHRSAVLSDWMTDLRQCSGCHWIYMDMIRYQPEILDPLSGVHEARWCMSKEDYDAKYPLSLV